MRWNVRKAKELKEIEGYKEVPQFMNVAKERRLVTAKYFIYMYDANSPLHKRIPEIQKRKEEAAILAGLKLSEEKDYKYAEQLWKLTQQLYVDIVVRILKVQKNKLFSLIVAQENYFDELMENMLKVVEIEDAKDVLASMKIKGQLSEEMDKVNSRLAAYYSDLFKGDDVVEAKVDLSSYENPASVARRGGGFG